MQRPDQTRRCGRVAVCGLLCLAIHGLGTAYTQTTSERAKPAQTSSPASPRKPTPKATKKSSAHSTQSATSKHTPSRVSSSASSRTSKNSHGKRVASKRGQQGIEPARAREIQAALIRQKYLQGEPSGAWDSATQAAMRRFQEDHGWQSKTIPDSRALIRLGLGPSSDHLLNPESAMTSAPADPVSNPAVDPKTGTKQTSTDNEVPQR
jgi:peptidoglycan hydrolase-like protein with peptidoglycan-binding domain